MVATQQQQPHLALGDFARLVELVGGQDQRLDLSLTAAPPAYRATSAQVLLPGVGVLVIGLAGPGRGPAGASASAFSMLAA